MNGQGKPDFTYTSRVGIGVHGETPVAIVNILSDYFSKSASSPEVAGVLKPDGYFSVCSSPAVFKQRVVTEIEP